MITPPPASAGAGPATPSRGFGRNVASLVGAAGLSQAATLAATPLLMLLYGPSAFGKFALVAMAATLVGGVAALRYERAIVLARRESDAQRLGRFCAVLGFVLPIFVAAALGFAPPPWLSAGDTALAVALAILVSFNTTGAAALSRTRRFRKIAKLESLGSLGAAVAQVAGGVAISRTADAADWQVTTLLVGAVLGRIAWVGVAMPMLLTDPPPRPLRLPRLLGRYWRLPVYSAPYAFVTNLQWRGLVLVASCLGGPAAAGQVAVALRVVFTPIGAVGAALRRVTFPDLSQCRDSSWLARRAAATIGWLGWVVVPTAILAVVVSGPGEAWLPAEWRPSVAFAVALVPAAAAMMFTCWLDQAFETLDRQGLALALEAASSLVALAVATLVGWLGGLVAAVVAYSLTLAIYNAFWLALTWKLLRWPAPLLRQTAARLASTTAALCPALALAPVSAWLAGAYLIGVSCLDTRRLATLSNLLLGNRRYA